MPPQETRRDHVAPYVVFGKGVSVSTRMNARLVGRFDQKHGTDHGLSVLGERQARQSDFDSAILLIGAMFVDHLLMFVD